MPLLVAAEAQAQQPQPQPPFGPAPGQPAPGQPGQVGPAPGQPGQFGQPGQPGQFGQPGPGQPGQFGQPGQPGQFGQPGQPGQFGQPGQPGQFGQPDPNQGQFGEQPPGGEPQLDQPAAPSEDDEWERRSMSLQEQPNLWGSTGGLRLSTAGSGAQGTFRVGFLIDWFQSNGFLCNAGNSTGAGVPVTCNSAGNKDDASHVGAFFTLNVTPLSFLEAYASIRTYASSNSEGRPQLLQVLGDTTFGAKGFLPERFGTYFNAGIEAQLMLLNGSGSVGVSGDSTSAAFRGLFSADFRKPQSQGGGFPFRADLNFGYKLDNSSAIVADVEDRRGEAAGLDGPKPIERIERFGLGINRTDFFQIGVGAMVPWKYVQPYLEYSVDIPINSRGYQCRTGRVSRGDVCLGLADFSAPDPTTAGGPGYEAIPSRLSIGVRATPFGGAFRGLSGHAAFDIGLSGTNVFIEEIAPTAPWTLYLGVGFAYDTKERPVPAAPAPQIIEKTQTVEKPQSFVRGFVHEAGKNDVVVADAIITIAGPSAQGPVATGADGRFLTRHVEPGAYSFAIKADGYKPGVCQANVVGGAPAMPQPQPQMQPQMQPQGPVPGQPWAPGQPGPFGPFGPQQGQPGMPGQPQPGMAPPQPQPEAPQGPTVVDVDCPLEALPKLGQLQGQVKDADSGSAVAGAVVKMTTADGKESTVTADGSGTFAFKDLPPGQVSIKVDASGYMVGGTSAEVRPNDTTRPTISVNKRPKVSLVRLSGNEIRILRQVHFETNSSKILGDSNGLLQEVADTISRTSSIKKVEIQGHTDNTGLKDSNLTLSQQRADSVRTFLISQGVDAAKLVAKGYGQERPIAPNITAGNRAKNRRVQFIILEGSSGK